MEDIVSKEILEKAMRGDLEAFESVYRASAGFVYNVAFRVVHNKEEAEEVVQDVFLKIYDKLKGFRSESSFKTWVYRITANAAINRYKRIAKEKERHVEFDENCDVAVDADKIGMDEKYYKDKVNDILDKLNPDQKACVVLRELEGLSYQEISSVLNVGINTVRTRLKRARERFMDLNKGGVENEL
ncbi:MAG TPA: RNA polymerase sigma factor [Candidatus Omnitrophota bacterium]|nr:RNA polymerase sigma factor [Candidatus Omnitrophota bacterium]